VTNSEVDHVSVSTSRSFSLSAEPEIEAPAMPYVNDHIEEIFVENVPIARIATDSH
jgi:hypothetical protein